MFEFQDDVQKIIVVGDLHGDFRTYQTILDTWRKEKDAFIIFLGDYADRGEQGIEIIESLIELSVDKRVVALKGNHEDYSLDGVPKFSPCTLINEVEKKKDY